MGTPATQPAAHNPAPMTITRTSASTFDMNGRTVAYGTVEFTDDRNRKVMLTKGPLDISVYVNPTRRSLGKHFRSPDEMLQHYKTLRAELTEALRIATGLAAEALAEA